MWLKAYGIPEVRIGEMVYRLEGDQHVTILNVDITLLVRVKEAGETHAALSSDRMGVYG